MSSALPDPSQPSQLDAKIRQIVYDVLSDPLSYPPTMTNWIQTFVSLNKAAEGAPIQTSPTASNPNR